MLIDGLIIGVAQAIALRHALARSYACPLVMAIAWLFGFDCAYAFENIFEANPLLSLFIAYGTAGLVIGTSKAIFIWTQGKTWKTQQEPTSSY